MFSAQNAAAPPNSIPFPPKRDICMVACSRSPRPEPAVLRHCHCHAGTCRLGVTRHHSCSLPSIQNIPPNAFFSGEYTLGLACTTSDIGIRFAIIGYTRAGGRLATRAEMPRDTAPASLLLAALHSRTPSHAEGSHLPPPSKPVCSLFPSSIRMNIREAQRSRSFFTTVSSAWFWSYVSLVAPQATWHYLPFIHGGFNLLLRPVHPSRCCPPFLDTPPPHPLLIPSGLTGANFMTIPQSR